MNEALGFLYPPIILLLITIGIQSDRKRSEKEKEKESKIQKEKDNKIKEQLKAIEGKLEKVQRPITITEKDIEYMKENDKKQDDKIAKLEIEIKRNSDEFETFKNGEFKAFKQEVKEEFKEVKREVKRAAIASNALSETGEKMIITWGKMNKIWETGNQERSKEQKAIMKELKKLTTRGGE